MQKSLIGKIPTWTVPLLGMAVGYWMAFAAFSVVAQVTNTNTVPGSGPATAPDGGMGLLLTLIPLVVPLIVAAAKAGIGKLPTWTLPIIATGFGALLNWILGLAHQPNTTVLNGALLGAAGVGVREVFDQIKGTVKTQEPPIA